jgi:hypothetical protein
MLGHGSIFPSHTIRNDHRRMSRKIRRRKLRSPARRHNHIHVIEDLLHRLDRQNPRLLRLNVVHRRIKPGNAKRIRPLLRTLVGQQGIPPAQRKILKRRGEDTSLVERAEERADRLVDYKDKRIGDAERAHEAVSRIADNIPLGQPILIGHHIERHARKDAERVENGMRKTVKMWHTAKYWEDRAKGALRHAKYKELPGVRHRRIKGLEADLRRYQNSFTPDPKTEPEIGTEERVWITNGSRSGRWAKSSSLPVIEQQSRRWIEHLQNRIAYEKAMRGEAGGIAAAQFTIEVGGRVLVADEWVVVLKLNSVSTSPLRHWHGNSTKVEIERVKDYRAPGPGDTEKVKAATRLPPLCNYPGDGFAQMTQAEWDKKHKDYKTTRAVEATATHARHRVRHAMTTGYKYGHIFITDAKRVDPLAAPLDPAGLEVFAREKDSHQGTDVSPSMEMNHAIHAAIPKDDRIPSYEQLHEMGKAAAAGVQVVIAPQLFPTRRSWQTVWSNLWTFAQGNRF